MRWHQGGSAVIRNHPPQTVSNQNSPGSNNEKVFRRTARKLFPARSDPLRTGDFLRRSQCEKKPRKIWCPLFHPEGISLRLSRPFVIPLYFFISYKTCKQMSSVIYTYFLQCKNKVCFFYRITAYNIQKGVRTNVSGQKGRIREQDVSNAG